MSCPHHYFYLPIDTTNYLLIHTNKEEVASSILPKIIVTKHNTKNKFFSSPSLVYLGCTPPWCKTAISRI